MITFGQRQQEATWIVATIQGNMYKWALHDHSLLGFYECERVLRILLVSYLLRDAQALSGVSVKTEHHIFTQD